MGKVVDWAAIRAEYVGTAITMRELGEKHGVSLSAIKRRAVKENWTANRTRTEPEVYQKTVRKVIEKTSTQNADRIVRLLKIGDKLLERVDQATGELDRMTVTRRDKTREITYGDPDAKGKPTKEVINEVECIDVVAAPVDRPGLNALTTALKNLHAVMQPAQESPATGEVKVVFEGGTQEMME